MKRPTVVARLRRLSLVTLAVLAGACQPHEPPAPFPADVVLPPPCVHDDTVYAAADSIRGVTGASPAYVVLPTGPIYHRVVISLLVGKGGRVEPDSTKILVSGGTLDDGRVRESANKTLFHPATRHGCGVAFRTAITLRGR